MKTLILMRHAKSSWENPSLKDFDRPLNDRGLRDASRMGKRLKEKDLAPGMLLTSPANRALSTCTILAEKIGFPVDQIQTNKKLYHAAEDQLMSVVHKLKDSDNVVMIFGHNPGFTDFANSLTKSRIDNVPTCGIVSCVFDVDTWKEVTWGNGTVQFFDYPKLHD